MNRSDVKHFAPCGNGRSFYWCMMYCYHRHNLTCPLGLGKRYGHNIRG